MMGSWFCSFAASSRRSTRLRSFGFFGALNWSCECASFRLRKNRKISKSENGSMTDPREKGEELHEARVKTVEALCSGLFREKRIHTVITVRKNSERKPDPDLPLNHADSYNGVLR